MTRKPTLCVDFDGVIHRYDSPWVDEVTIADGPVPGAIEWLWKASEVFDVVIYSSRSKTEAGRQAMANWLEACSIEEHRDQTPPVRFSAEKPAAFLTIDDRAICFHGNFDAISPKELLNFKPWNKGAQLP